jgi:hypothetical protein
MSYVVALYTCVVGRSDAFLKDCFWPIPAGQPSLAGCQAESTATASTGRYQRRADFLHQSINHQATILAEGAKYRCAIHVAKLMKLINQLRNSSTICPAHCKISKIKHFYSASKIGC